ncbi:MAG: glycoside hydrolase family 3 C-terminal domain-containing protein [Ignavibacteriales bacterium]|nr:glycoside hydrolase family 3 C-terminal domain-containing protein [Ignavibacteriales bacterium]
MPLLLISATSAPAQLMPIDSSWVEQTLHQMSLDEKIGQLIMPAHLDFNQSSEMVQQLNVGGFWFGKAEAKWIAGELNKLQELSKYPLLIAADFEKGAGTHVDGATDLPINMALGASRNTRLVYSASQLTAKEARSLGVHLNFAPVLDVNNNPKNPIINIRSFGEDPKLVAELGTAAIRGYQENGLLSTAKHFPGHGNTSVDSHSRLGMIESEAADFESVELLPYREVLKKSSTSAVMTAHLWVKPIDSDTIPATLSPNAIGQLLRNRLKYPGIVITDAMVMGGITSTYSLADASVRTLRAGCDIILWPGNPTTSVEALKNAILTGLLPEERINESVRRILRAKTEVGLHKNRLVDIAGINDFVGTEENYQEAKRIAAGCLTLVKDKSRLLPLSSSQKVLVVTLSTRSRNAAMSRTLVSFPADMKKQNALVDTLVLSESLSPSETRKAVELAGKADVVVLAAFVRIVIGSGTVELPETHKALVDSLLKANSRTILVSFGNPYIGGSFLQLSAYICAYDNAKALQEVAAEALFGKKGFSGRLPVTISEEMKFGDGIITK